MVACFSGLRSLRDRDLHQTCSRASSGLLRVCPRLSRDHTPRQRRNSIAPEFVLRLPQNSHLGITPPFRARHASERSLLVAHRRDGLAEPAPEKLPLQRYPLHRRRRHLAGVFLELEARPALGPRHRGHPKPCSPSLVLHLDSSTRHLAPRLRLARPLCHALRLLPLLERTPLCLALALRTLAARNHSDSAPHGWTLVRPHAKAPRRRRKSSW